jgi:uncharacterized Zn finger protein
MKIRSGFVSNSSSSSFIIAVKKGLSKQELTMSVKELINDFREQMETDIPEMFGEDEHPYLDIQDEEKVVLWNDVEKDLIIDFNRITKDNNNLELAGYSIEMGTICSEETYGDINDLICEFRNIGFDYKSNNIVIHFGDG